MTRWLPLVTLLAVHLSASELRPVSTACTVTSLTCGQSISGLLQAGDCTTNGGSYADLLSFAAPSLGTEVEVTVTPLDGQQLYVTMIPPNGDGSVMPATRGPGEILLTARMTSNGVWGVQVSGDRLSDAGRYNVRLRCFGNPPAGPAGCTVQGLDCGQTSYWVLNAASCQTSQSKLPYADFWHPTKIPGDFLRFTAESYVFRSGVGIYDGAGSRLDFNWSSRAGNPATASYLASTPADYFMSVFSADPTEGGRFTAKLECQSTCAPATITQQPTNVVVPWDGVATLAVIPGGSQPFTYLWRDADNNLVGSSYQLTLSHVRTAQNVWVQVSNGCGTAASRIVSVTPGPAPVPRRRRAATTR